MDQVTAYGLRPDVIDILNKVALLMADGLELENVAPAVLRLLCQRLDMHYAALSLLDAESGEIAIEIADGLSGEEIRSGRYRLGVGVTGIVAATREPAVVPRISQCPDFLNQTARHTPEKDGSFVCVPVVLGRETLGALALDGEPKDEAELRSMAQLLGIIAAMLAQSIQLRFKAKERQASLVSENRRLKNELRDRDLISPIIGKSREMQIVLDQIAQVADSPSTVLISGETGCGKELVAHALHYNGSRRDRPFVRVNCAALPETLIESELFGHEKGAFTGAVVSRAGRFEQADGGTIFLDEIGDVSPLMQVKLLRVLQEREFERVGGNQTIKVDVRVVAATNQDLTAMVKQGKFRGDLYYRINVFPIRLPPLRCRKNDLPLLAEYFLRKYSERAGKRVDTISPEALEVLAAHTWPGNVRELENSMEHAVILADGPVLKPEHLPAIVKNPDLEETAPGFDYKTRVENFERELLVEALNATRGNITQAAARLGATTRVVSYRVRQLGIDLSLIR